MYDGRKCGYIREGERRKNGRSRCMREREGREGWKGKPAPEGLRI